MTVPQGRPGFPGQPFYDERVDIWCLGVLLFSLIYNDTTPFLTDPFDKDRIREKIRKLDYTFPNNKHPMAADLIKQILVPPHRRLTLD
jgi:serine/threonine protein kinase